MTPADPVTVARKTAAWQRDVPRGCCSPHTWRGDHWQRREGATCGVHTVGQLLAQEAR